MMRKGNSYVFVLAISFLFVSLLPGCSTYQGYQGASLGAITGSTAGALIDDGNPWRGALIGGGLGAIFGGAMTDRPRHGYPYYETLYGQPSYSYYPSQPYYSYHPYYSRSPYHEQPGYYSRQYIPQYYVTPRYNSPNYVGRGAAFGGVTGATAGALIDHGNRWRGGLIGGFLGSIFGGGIGAINSGPRIPALYP